MKTNHQRSLKDRRSSRAVFARYHTFYNARKLEIADMVISAVATCGDACNGKHGIAKSRRGAKKFINSRSRFHENAALKKIAQELQ